MVQDLKETKVAEINVMEHVIRDLKEIEVIKTDNMTHRSNDDIGNVEALELVAAVARGPTHPAAGSMDIAFQAAVLFEPSLPAELRPSGHESLAAAHARLTAGLSQFATLWGMMSLRLVLTDRWQDPLWGGDHFRLGSPIGGVCL